MKKRLNTLRRLVLHKCNGYLTGGYQSRIPENIGAVRLHTDSFPPDDAVHDILSRTDFLQVLPHFRFTGEVPPLSGLNHINR